MLNSKVISPIYPTAAKAMTLVFYWTRDVTIYLFCAIYFPFETEQHTETNVECSRFIINYFSEAQMIDTQVL